MNPRKRQASDTLPIRRHKQPRLTLKGYSGGKPSPSEKEGLLSRWNRFRMDFVALSADTLTVIFSSLWFIGCIYEIRRLIISFRNNTARVKQSKRSRIAKFLELVELLHPSTNLFASRQPST